MRKSFLIGLILVVIVLIIYMNRSYAHIYNKIKEVNLISSDKQQTYDLGNNFENELIYVAIGDSLTTGVGVDSFRKSYPFQVAEMIAQQKNKVVLNIQAVAGGKSIDIINQFIETTIDADPDLITLFLGINDVHGNISKKEFRDNYEIILKRLTKETKAKIYIINLPYLGAKNLILPPYDFYFNKRTQEFNEVLEQLADNYKLKYIDLYTPTFKLSEERYYSTDLFHPSDFGYKLWSQIIYDNLN